ncbi:unnamed protein product [Prorocentrum cordatum]|uniref:peptide deformylase n=1 Tax=Prorocentrum cordatum TaxID=2364126 RepID=A0ABN9T882_9DINO|nr:unnamed protein product [Polarella glacialis]
MGAPGARRPRRAAARALLLVPALGLAGRLCALAGCPGTAALLPGALAGRAAAGAQAWRRHGGSRRSSCISRWAKGFSAKGGLDSIIKKSRKLPPYVDIYKTRNSTRRALLRRRSQDVGMPLSKQDARYCNILEAKFDNETNCVGLAAPQIGIDRRIIVFEVLADDPDNEGRNVTQEMSKVLWINPSYSPLTDEMQYDYSVAFGASRRCARAVGCQQRRQQRPQANIPGETAPSASKICNLSPEPRLKDILASRPRVGPEDIMRTVPGDPKAP